jgi:Fe-S cluster biogenesis protein NfuA
MMATAPNDREFRQRMGRIETLIQEIERFPDAGARAHTREIVQSLLDLHGAGLERILEHLAAAGNQGLALIDSLARDELVESLLLLYGLHPLDIEIRVRQALDQVRPYLRSHAGNVELLALAGGVVRLRLLRNSWGSASAQTLQRAVEEAIYRKAPDVTAIEVEEVTTDEPPVKDGRARIALPVLSG